MRPWAICFKFGKRWVGLHFGRLLEAIGQLHLVTLHPVSLLKECDQNCFCKPKRSNNHQWRKDLKMYKKFSPQIELTPNLEPILRSLVSSPALYKFTTPRVAWCVFENKNIFFYILWKTLQHSTTLALYVAVNSEVVGLAPGHAWWSKNCWKEITRMASKTKSAVLGIAIDTWHAEKVLRSLSIAEIDVTL
jgi:hypothetical protein